MCLANPCILPKESPSSTAPSLPPWCLCAGGVTGELWVSAWGVVTELSSECQRGAVTEWGLSSAWGVACVWSGFVGRLLRSPLETWPSAHAFLGPWWSASRSFPAFRVHKWAGGQTRHPCAYLSTGNGPFALVTLRSLETSSHHLRLQQPNKEQSSRTDDYCYSVLGHTAPCWIWAVLSWDRPQEFPHFSVRLSYLLNLWSQEQVFMVPPASHRSISLCRVAAVVVWLATAL